MRWYGLYCYYYFGALIKCQKDDYYERWLFYYKKKTPLKFRIFNDNTRQFCTHNKKKWLWCENCVDTSTASKNYYIEYFEVMIMLSCDIICHFWNNLLDFLQLMYIYILLKRCIYIQLVLNELIENMIRDEFNLNE